MTIDFSDSQIPLKLAAANCAYWVHLNQIQLQSGTFQFKGHEYLAEPMQSTAQIEVTMKATQGGFTESEVLRKLWGCIHGYYPSGVLYLFPTTDDVLDFSKSRFNSLIQRNPEAIGRFVKSGGKGTDSAQLKKIGDSYLFFRGAVLNRGGAEMSESRESSKLRGIPVDAVTYDEWDLMNPDVRKKAAGRMGHSAVKEERFLSNPTVPSQGIDRLFGLSDQRHWYRRCTCTAGDLSAWTCAELEFPDCVRTGPDKKGYIACKKCGRALPIYPGQWIAAYPGRAIIGRRWSQLTSIYNDPAQILAEYLNPQDSNIADFYRLRLGLPYVSKEDQLRKAEVYECCCGEPQASKDAGPCAMGVDVGKIKHILIGSRTGRNTYEIIKAARLSAWEDIHDLAMRFNVKSAVIDIRPYEDEARQFQKAEPYRIWLCQYNETTIHDAQYNEKTKVVTVNRTQIFDASHRIIAGRNLILPRRDAEIEEVANQLCNAYKILETNKKTGTSIYRYHGENEHYRNALNYFLLAADPKRLPQKKSRILMLRNRTELKADNTYSRSRF